MKRFVLLFAIVANLVFADELVKELAERLLARGEFFSVIPGFFDLALVHNRGCAWGMFQGQVWLLAVFGLAALAVLVWQRKKIFDFPVASPRPREGARVTMGDDRPREGARVTMGDDRPREGARVTMGCVAEPLLYAGIVGNVIDRLFRGYVVDMFDFHWHDAYHYPCFNLADTYICIAAGLLILSSFFHRNPSAPDSHRNPSALARENKD